jgi:hypothetical protein
MIPFLQHVRVDLPGKAEGRPGSPYFRQSRRPRGTSSAALSFWELCDIKVSGYDIELHLRLRGCPGAAD